MKWRSRTVLGVAGVITAVAVWTTVLSLAARGRRYRAEITQSLQSPDPDTRKRAAWTVIERPDLLLEALIVRVLGDEANPDVREAYVYALGRLRDPRNFSAIEAAIDSDPSGYVRAAAWLAAARTDPQHFRTLARAQPRPEQPWDRIGISQGRLYLGDVGGVGELLRRARDGDDSQRRVASRAMFKWLRPLLDAAGRWPADAPVREGDIWPPGFVGEIERRCAELDLPAVADDTRPCLEEAARVRRNVARLTRARDGLADLLLGHQYGRAGDSLPGR